MELSNVEIWAILGVLFLIVEIFATSFFFLFLGIGALVVALFAYLGFTETLPAELAIFILSTGVSMLLFRKQLRDVFNRKGEEYKEMVDEYATAMEDFDKNGNGTVLFRGANWMAYTTNGATVEKDAKVVIRKVDGIKLAVELV